MQEEKATAAVLRQQLTDEQPNGGDRYENGTERLWCISSSLSLS